jgi:tRNA dimethylallyltransferase
LDSRFEIVNADSMQAYSGMDLGTAKPSERILARLPHHLVSFLPPSVQYNAGDFVKRAEKLVDEIACRGRYPIVCGGTAFYIRCFLFGLPGSPEGGGETRSRLRGLEREKGSAALREELARRDPEAAVRIAPTDRYRTERALEILESSGRSVFSYQWPRSLRRDYRFSILGLRRPREELYQRIDARVDAMFAAGLAGEVRGLMEIGCLADDPGMKAIGYREFFEMRKGCLTFTDVKELIKRDSRRYAKRQMTFFRSIPEVQWVSAADMDGIRSHIEAYVQGWALDHGRGNQA